MNGHRTPRSTAVAVTAGICTMISASSWAEIVATGRAQMSNIRCALENPNDGTVDWGQGAWRGQSWAEVSDCYGGSDADYSEDPDGSGLISAFAETPRAWGRTWAHIWDESLLAEGRAETAVGAWARSAEYSNLSNSFRLIPAGRDGDEPMDMEFAFDYEIHLTGIDAPGGGYYADASVGLSVSYVDDFGDWQKLEDGQLFMTKVIEGDGGGLRGHQDLNVSGTLDMTLGLQPNLDYLLVWSVYTDPETLVIPAPGVAAALLGAGMLAVRRRR